MRGRPGVRRLPLLLAAAALLVTGCTAGPAEDRPDGTDRPEAAGSDGSATPSALPEPDYDLSGLPVARAPFCRLLDEAAVSRALGSGVLRTAHYRNGDRVEIVPGVVDVAAEHNCTFEGLSPARARAWVFARPVARREAQRLARAQSGQRDCSFPDPFDFGTPDLTSVCRVAAPEPALRVTAAGLFGDAWLSCELTLPRGQERRAVRERQVLAAAEQWCVGVVSALGARP